jgi:hypothetical protein
MEPSLSHGNRQPFRSELGPTSRESDRTAVSASMSWSLNYQGMRLPSGSTSFSASAPGSIAWSQTTSDGEGTRRPAAKA